MEGLDVGYLISPKPLHRFILISQLHSCASLSLCCILYACILDHHDQASANPPCPNVHPASACGGCLRRLASRVKEKPGSRLKFRVIRNKTHSRPTGAEGSHRVDTTNRQMESPKLNSPLHSDPLHSYAAARTSNNTHCARLPSSDDRRY